MEFRRIIKILNQDKTPKEIIASIRNVVMNKEMNNESEVFQNKTNSCLILHANNEAKYSETLMGVFFEINNITN